MPIVSRGYQAHAKRLISSNVIHKSVSVTGISGRLAPDDLCLCKLAHSANALVSISTRGCVGGLDKFADLHRCMIRGARSVRMGDREGVGRGWVRGGLNVSSEEGPS